MKESLASKKRRILEALLSGRKLTPFEADKIGNTTEGTRLIRFIRRDYPVKSERVEGEMYHRYWIDEVHLAELRNIGKEVSEGTFFENLVTL